MYISVGQAILCSRSVCDGLSPFFAPEGLGLHLDIVCTGQRSSSPNCRRLALVGRVSRQAFSRNFIVPFFISKIYNFQISSDFSSAAIDSRFPCLTRGGILKGEKTPEFRV